MKNLKTIISLLFLSSLFLMCSKEEGEIDSIEIVKFNPTSSTSGLFEVKINNAKNVNIINCGIDWTSPGDNNFNGDFKRHEVSPEKNGFTTEITSFIHFQQRTVRAFAQTKSKTYFSTPILIDLYIFPQIETTDLSDITDSSAQSGGKVILGDSLDAVITERGLCWSTKPRPTINDFSESKGSGPGVYIVNMTNLNSSTKYYCRSYYKNKGLIYYGPEKEFITKVQAGVNMVDIHGKIYNSVVLFGKTWTTSNLAVEKYANGDNIPNVENNADWTALSSGGFCYYSNNSFLKATNGCLYNFYAVVDQRGLCPSGWRVTTDEDWRDLEINIGMEPMLASSFGNRGNISGGLKSDITSFWSNQSNGATNLYNLNIIGSGFRFNTGTFASRLVAGLYWTSSTYQNNGIFRDFRSSNTELLREHDDKRFGMAVRCIKN